jgi:hypothetical protein
MEEMRNSYRLLARKIEGKGPLERPKHMWQDNIQKNLTEIWWEGIEWIHCGQKRDKHQARVP